MNDSKAFVDTNIFVYAFSKDDSEKKEAAVNLLENYDVVISIQVIREFCNILIKQSNISIAALRSIVLDIAHKTKIVNEDYELLLYAADIKERYSYSFYDSLIIAAALYFDCKVLISEDMQDGQLIENTLKIINPFNID